MELLKLLLRYLVSFIATGILFAVIGEIMHLEMAYFRYDLYYFLMPANFVISGLFYFAMPYISRKVRVVLLVVLTVVLICCKLTDNANLVLLISSVLIVHLAIPNFHYGDHYLDKKLNWWQSVLLAIILLAAIIKHLLFWEDFQIII